MENRDKIIERIKDNADRNHPDSEIFLYGSRARKDSRAESDWDLLLLMNDTSISFEKEVRIMDDFYNLELETGEVFSPLIYSKNDWVTKYLYSPLYQIIEKEGIRLR